MMAFMAWISSADTPSWDMAELDSGDDHRLARWRWLDKTHNRKTASGIAAILSGLLQQKKGEEFITARQAGHCW